MAISPPNKIKYLTNKDLLEEIHLSKSTYCSYVDPTHMRYDFIVSNVSMITKQRIDDARKKKLADMQAVEKKENVSKGIKDFKSQLTIDNIPPDSIVVRVMTFDHIPINEEKIGKAKTEVERHIRCNFPPYQHYIMKDLDLVCVLKSHWKGGLENGHFSKDHGKMTNNLALMFMKLVDRYGHRGNWRGYCVDETTEALTQRGWLGINDITEADQILSYDQDQMKWSSIKSIYRGHYNGLMHWLTSSAIDALVTPGHKFVTHRGLIPVEQLLPTDLVILMGAGNADPTPLCNNSIKDEDMLLALRACSGNVGQLPLMLAKDINFNSGWNGAEPIPTVPYNGMVWCPETEYGCFVARRNGTVYLTGNTYIDEMKSQALLQLSQVGLQFDESRSDSPNPFAYYTQTITNSFMRILNVEKKNQNIRDDILIMNGATPSWTRQTDDSIKQQKEP
jgi:hypothetical protein